MTNLLQGHGCGEVMKASLWSSDYKFTLLYFFYQSPGFHAVRYGLNSSIVANNAYIMMTSLPRSGFTKLRDSARPHGTSSQVFQSSIPLRREVTGMHTRR